MPAFLQWARWLQVGYSSTCLRYRYFIALVVFLAVCRLSYVAWRVFTRRVSLFLPICCLPSWVLFKRLSRNVGDFIIPTHLQQPLIASLFKCQHLPCVCSFHSPCLQHRDKVVLRRHRTLISLLLHNVFSIPVVLLHFMMLDSVKQRLFVLDALKQYQRSWGANICGENLIIYAVCK